MTIFVLDDEPIALRGSVKTITKVVPDADICSFGNAKAVFRYIEENGIHPDVVFSDIEMPGTDGLAFAARLKQACPDAALIFVTAYSQYALDAFRLHVHGYILKPLKEDRVREELQYALMQNGREDSNTPQASADSHEENHEEQAHKDNSRRLTVQCFGYFEVFWKGTPLMFARRQTKELLAYLIDRRGAACTSEEIAAALWEDEDNMKNLKARIRIMISDLKKTLAEIGMDDLIIRRTGQIAIRREMIDCDYYRMLDGDIDAANEYKGDYMLQYSWAEVTAGQLSFRM